jgi:Ca-activated chloride channel family protein
MNLPGFDSQMVLIALLILPSLYIVYLKIISKKKKEAIKFSNLEYIKAAINNKRKSRRDTLLLLIAMISIGSMIVGFANPHIPLEQSKEGVNVVLVIDDSGSMQAKDYKPDRLEAAKDSSKILIQSLLPKDNAGIVVFGTGATTAAYLSPNKDKVLEKLSNIAPTDGETALGDGLSLGIDMATSIQNQKKVIILLSDGASNAGVITPAEAISFAKANNIQVFTVGLGTTGKTLLGYDFFGNPQYAELDENTLKSIAEKTDGKYFRSVDTKTLSEIYKNIGSHITRENEETNIKDWFFAIALGSIFVQFYFRYGRGRIIQ